MGVLGLLETPWDRYRGIRRKPYLTLLLSDGRLMRCSQARKPYFTSAILSTHIESITLPARFVHYTSSIFLLAHGAISSFHLTLRDVDFAPNPLRSASQASVPSSTGGTVPDSPNSLDHSHNPAVISSTRKMSMTSLFLWTPISSTP
jgi:hypothetical protein